jgi:hypothetical protein
MAEMVVSGDLPKPDAFIFADTGDEPAYVYKQVEYYKKRVESVGVPFIIVNNGSLHDDLYSGRKRFVPVPLFTRTVKNERSGFGMQDKIYQNGKMKRQCTNEYKIVPVHKEIRIMLLEMNLAREDRLGRIYANKGVSVDSWFGFTIDEVERMKPSRLKWENRVYPLIEKRMYRTDCESWLRKRGLPIPKSSACRKCPLISNARMRELREHDPAGWENRLDFDRHLRDGTLNLSATMKGELFLSEKMTPLDEVDINEQDSNTLFSCYNGSCAT